MLDTLAACPPLTREQQQQYAAAKAADAARCMPEAVKVRAAYVAKHAAALVKRTGCTLAEAMNVVEYQCRGILLPDVVLVFDDKALAGSTVGDVLDDPARFKGCTLADPIEGIGYGPCKAMVMVDSNDTPWIKTFAHGGGKYALEREPLPEWLKDWQGKLDEDEDDNTEDRRQEEKATTKNADGAITAHAYDFPVEEDIAPYDWLMGKHLLRGEVSGTAAMGGTGKSILAIIEALAMASGRKLLHDAVNSCRPLRVVLINLEDKRNTMAKRIAAAMRHYGLTKADIEDRLIVVARGEIKIKVAEPWRFGGIARGQIIKELTDFVRTKQADVLSIDSFIRTHGLNENDNSAIQEVVECFEDIAGPANCAVHLWHHTRKMGGDKSSVEAARGAMAFIDACRSVRILETMTRKERDELVALVPDIGEPGYYFRGYNGKRNFAPPSDQSDWFKFVSVKLNNCPDDFPESGDNVGVVTAWYYPRVDLPQATEADVTRALAAVAAGGPWRADQRSTKEPWVGVAIAQALQLDLLAPGVKKGVAKRVKDWLEAGRLRVVTRPDRHGDQRDYVEVPVVK